MNYTVKCSACFNEVGLHIDDFTHEHDDVYFCVVCGCELCEYDVEIIGDD